MNPWTITETNELISAVERIKPPASYLADTFFPQIMPASASEWLSVEYSKQGRMLAPYIVSGAHGINMARAGSTVQSFKPPVMAPRRVISQRDIQLRQFGEQPVYSSITPAERAAQMQANDLNELLRMIQNRKNEMAASILQTGKVTVSGFADDGLTAQESLIEFDWGGGIAPSKKWSVASADIYGDIKRASEKIQEESGLIPTVMICGKNVEGYLLANEGILKWLSIPNRDNLAMMNFAPQYITPQVRLIGYLSALNLEVISYSETYLSGGVVTPFVDPDTVIIGVPGRGKQLYGAVTYLTQDGQWLTAAAQNVPVYNFDANAQQSSLTIFSRCVLVPETPDDFISIKTTTL